MNLTWVAVMLILMGLVFSGVAVTMQLVPIAPENITVRVNGVIQPSTEQSVFEMRLIFLLSFGIVGAGLLIAGFVVAGRMAARKKLARYLKDEGLCITAQATECTPTSVRVNRRYLTRLNCAYAASDGITYIFKSGTLRMNPMPYLNQGEVKVYHDRNNIKRYFVDIDGSVGAGTKVIEL